MRKLKMTRTTTKMEDDEDGGGRLRTRTRMKDDDYDAIEVSSYSCAFEYRFGTYSTQYNLHVKHDTECHVIKKTRDSCHVVQLRLDLVGRCTSRDANG